MVNAISAVGTAYTQAATSGATTLSVTPTTVGNCLIVATNTTLTTDSLSLSGGGCAQWVRLAGPFVGSSTALELWVGTITTTGASTITFTGSPSALSGGTNGFMAQEFGGGGAGTAWAGETWGTITNGAASTSMAYPTLMPGGASRLYVGFAKPVGTSNTTATAGYTLQAEASGGPTLIYNASVSTSQAPTSGQTSATSSTIAVVVVASSAGVIAPVGRAISTTATAATTLALTTVNVGDLVVVGSWIGSATVHISSLSGGGVTTWNHPVGPSVLSGVASSLDLWWGVVTTAGDQTITFTGSAALTSLSCGYVARQFTIGGAGSVWAIDGTQTGTKTNTSAALMTFPTLTPSGAGRLYVGAGISAGFGAGYPLTSGYANAQVAQVALVPLIYNTSVSTAQSPTATGGSTATSLTDAAVFIGTVPPPTSSPRLMATALVPRLRSFNY